MDTDELIIQMETNLEEDGILDNTKNNVSRNENENNSVKPKYDLFVSYSTEDEEEVIMLCRELEDKHKLRCMIAARDFHLGIPVLDNCRLRMYESEKVLLIITPSFLNSRWCTLESYQALMTTPLGQRGKVIPVLFKPVESELPDYLSMYTYIDKEKVSELSLKIFEAFHNPVIVDGVRKKIRKERKLTREEISNQNGARLLVMQSCKVTPGCRGIQHHFPPLTDNNILDKVRDYYDNLRLRLNDANPLRSHELNILCCGKQCLLSWSILLIGALFLVLVTRILILVHHTDSLSDGEIATIVVLCVTFVGLSICLPICLHVRGKKRLKKLSEEIWNDSMNSIDQNRFIVVMEGSPEYDQTIILHFVRYDITECKKYTLELLKVKYPNRSQVLLQSEAERMVKAVLHVNRHFLIKWEMWNEVMEDNRHNTWLDRPCACQLVARNLNAR